MLHICSSLATTRNSSLLMQNHDLAFVFCFWNHTCLIFSNLTYGTPPTGFPWPQEIPGCFFRGRCSRISPFWQERWQGTTVSTIPNNNRRTSRTYNCCSNATCNFQSYLFRSLFAWIHPTARPLLSYSITTVQSPDVWVQLHCLPTIFFGFLLCQTDEMTTKSPPHWCPELRCMFKLGSI